MTSIKWFTYSIKSSVVRSYTRRYYEYLWTPSGLLLLVPMVTRTRSVVIAAGSGVATCPYLRFIFLLLLLLLLHSPPSLSLNHGRAFEWCIDRFANVHYGDHPTCCWRDFTSWLMIEPTSLTKLNKSILTSEGRIEIPIKESKCNTILFLSKVSYTCASQLKLLARFKMLTITSYTNIILIYLTSLLSILKGYKIWTIDL